MKVGLDCSVFYLLALVMTLNGRNMQPFKDKYFFIAKTLGVTKFVFL